MRSSTLKTCACLVALVALGAAGCARAPGGVAASNIPLTPGGYEELGRVSASDCKVNLLGFIPVSGSNYVSGAMRNAMRKRAGTDALVDISVDHVFKFFILWSQNCTEVRATAVRIR